MLCLWCDLYEATAASFLPSHCISADLIDATDSKAGLNKILQIVVVLDSRLLGGLDGRCA
jgi:hypothetical protein